MTRKARIFDAARGVCHICGRKIKVGEAWDAEHVVAYALTHDDSDENIRPAHTACHKLKTKDDVRVISKAKRVRAKHMGATVKPRSLIPGSRGSGLRKRMDGTVVHIKEDRK